MKQSQTGRANSREARRNKPSKPNDKNTEPAGNGIRKPSRLLTIMSVILTLPIVVIWIGNMAGAEIFWPVGINQYMPQWIWLSFPAILMIWYLVRCPRFSYIPLIVLLIVLGPIMGLNFHLHRPNPTAKVRLRVMTYNIKWGKRNQTAIENDINRYNPDLMMLQDAGGTMEKDMGNFLAGWNVQHTDQYIIASRYPLRDADVRWISYPEHNHRVLRCIANIQNHPIVIYSCHLASPRFGLLALKHPRKGISSLLENIDFRLKESERLAEHVRGERLPVLFGGDLNGNVNSFVCKNLFAVGMNDCFSEAGSGYGYTYGGSTKLKVPFTRIDHIMTSSHWRVVSCWVGNTTGSDHCPVFADVELIDSSGH